MKGRKPDMTKMLVTKGDNDQSAGHPSYTDCGGLPDQCGGTCDGCLERRYGPDLEPDLPDCRCGSMAWIGGRTGCKDWCLKRDPIPESNFEEAAAKRREETIQRERLAAERPDAEFLEAYMPLPAPRPLSAADYRHVQLGLVITERDALQDEVCVLLFATGKLKDEREDLRKRLELANDEIKRLHRERDEAIEQARLYRKGIL